MSVQLPAPPEGARWVLDPIATDRGRVPLGEIPVLEWESIGAVIAFYGEDGAHALVESTPLRATMQGIGRRLLQAGKSTFEIASAVLEYRPGKRSASTPQSRARRALAAASEVQNPEGLAAFLAKVASGQIKLDEYGNPSNS